MKPNWKNRSLWTGDNLGIMRDMNSETVDLIYLDPPFNTNRIYGASAEFGKALIGFKDRWKFDDATQEWLDEIATKNPRLYRIVEQAEAAHSKAMMCYLSMMAVRLLEMRRILKPLGSLYLHCDPTSSHYLKIVLDCIFAAANFRNEIIWLYGLGGSSKRVFSKKHDVLLFYVKDKKKAYVFHKPTEPSTAAGRRGIPKGMRDVWTDIPTINNMSIERTGYPTQKPLKLLKRIISTSSNEGDMVFDPFCGCATSLLAAEELKRQWVGIDLSELSIKLIKQRAEKHLHIPDIAVHTDRPVRQACV